MENEYSIKELELAIKEAYGLTPEVIRLRATECAINKAFNEAQAYFISKGCKELNISITLVGDVVKTKIS